MSVLSNGPGFQACSKTITSCNHWWSMPLSTEFIFCTFFNYKWNHSFIIALWFPLATKFTGIIKVSWMVFLNIQEKISASTTIIFGISNRTKKFPKAHRETWSDVIYFSLLDDPIPDHFIQSRKVRILWDPYWSRMSPGSQNNRNITSNGVSDSIIWSFWCASLDHEFTNWKDVQALMN